LESWQEKRKKKISRRLHIEKISLTLKPRWRRAGCCSTALQNPSVKPSSSRELRFQQAMACSEREFIHEYKELTPLWTMGFGVAGGRTSGSSFTFGNGIPSELL
jgi:hypothetical protein